MTTTLVEFVGPPAAGKTTLSRAVADHLDDQLDVPVLEPSRAVTSRSAVARILTKLGYALWQFIRAPRQSLADIYDISRTDQRTLGDALSVALNWQYICGLSRRASGVTLLDQGIYQALWSIGYRAGRPWDETLRCLTVPEPLRSDLVVVVHTDRETLADRLQSRNGDSRIEHSTIDHGLNGIDQLEEVLDEHGTRTVSVETTTDESFHEGVRTVVDYIEESRRRD